jgi:translation initiation factor 2D
LVDRVQFAGSPYYLILRNTSTPDHSSKPKAGTAPKVLVTMETRSGNKTVTKISGLETFFIPPQPLADELRKTCAGSTSVDQLVGSSPKNPVMEVMVQGPQKQTVLSALEKRGVTSKWVDVVDKTKKK